jgi:hypothetical protein
MFRFRNNKIVNEKGKVVDVSGGIDREGQNLIIYNDAQNRISQEWTIVYVDEDKEEPKKGELNEDFGMYVERSFYVETHLPSKRWLEIHGNNIVIRDQAYGQSTQ